MSGPDLGIKNSSALAKETEQGLIEGRESNFRCVYTDLVAEMEMAQDRIKKLEAKIKAFNELITTKQNQMVELSEKWDAGITDIDLGYLRREFNKTSVHKMD